MDRYNAQSDTRALPLDASDPAPMRKLIDACHLLSPNRGGMAKPMRVLICGVPNVGKSTLINTLSNKRQAKTGDERRASPSWRRATSWACPRGPWPPTTKSCLKPLAANARRHAGGGRVNLQKTAEIVMTDFRTAILGRITRETPQEFEAWRDAGLAEDAKRQAKKDARTKAQGKGSGVREPAAGDGE